MDNDSFFTLSSGGMQPGSSYSSPSASFSSLPPESSPASSVSATTHDTRRTKYHIDELGTFAKRLEDAAASIFPNRDRCRYNDVQVLLLRWQHDDMQVECELDDLAETFKNAYGFNTETWLIPTTQPHLALMGKAFKMVQDFGKKDNLLIVYYAGHGGMNSSRQPLWTCTSAPGTPSLQWYAIQTIFEQADSDTLLLLDCCAAASGAPAEGNGTSVTETIAACGFETWAPQPGRHSFTHTLITVLDEWCGHPGFTAAMLHCEVLNRLRHEKPERKGKMKKFECRRTPVHILSTADAKAGSVELCRRLGTHKCPENAESEAPEEETSIIEGEEDIEAPSKSNNPSTSADPSIEDSQNLYEPDSLIKVLSDGSTAIPQVLISLSLEEEQLLDLDQCRRWLQQFPALAKFANVQGVYRSNSTLMILSVPVLIWDWIPDDPACSFIGYVHSWNLLDLEHDKECIKGQSETKLEREAKSCRQNQSPENSDASTLIIGFHEIAESDESSLLSPALTNPFRGPPPPVDIASRRKKVQHKPAALTADTLRNHPPIGPRTVSHPDGFRRPMDSQTSQTTASCPSDTGFGGMHVKESVLVGQKPLIVNAEEANSRPLSHPRQLAVPGPGSHAWTVHVSLLPTRTQPFPFEKDTAAYKRCLSRGLHQMIVVPDLDGISFKTTVDEAFSVNLRGRQWEPLVAKICDAEGLRGLPMLRPLPEYLVGSDYNAEFLKHNCAIVDKKGKILDLYIAMSEGTISWVELKEASPFTLGLEAAWAYDPYLDGIYATEDRIHQVTKRYSSNKSNMSASSSRNVQRLQAQIALTDARPLMPKSYTGGLQMSRENWMDLESMIQFTTVTPDVATAPGKPLTVLKPMYTRPKHPVLFCQLCDSHQGGFRGEHELQRHQDREHKPSVKKWICIQPTDPGHPNPVVELSRCKSCKQPKKYGAYYNAAAHLRRAHFRPKSKSERAKLNSKVEDAEQRGGKGGGDWPPMSELKFWMKEVEVPVDDTISSPHPDLAESDVADDDVCNDLFEVQDGRVSPVSSLARTLVNEPFSSAHFSPSMNIQALDFEKPDISRLEDGLAVVITDGYSWEQAQFVD